MLISKMKNARPQFGEFFNDLMIDVGSKYGTMSSKYFECFTAAADVAETQAFIAANAAEVAELSSKKFTQEEFH